MSPSEVTNILRDGIRQGRYTATKQLPTLNELNADFFAPKGYPALGRAAYAPLIAEGLVKVIQGEGHFLVAR
jgi:DNA-binding GntR family transcriptional regulator